MVNIDLFYFQKNHDFIFKSNPSEKKCWSRKQERIQRFKEVTQTGYVSGFPLAAAWISRSTLVMICVELSTLTH